MGDERTRVELTEAQRTVLTRRYNDMRDAQRAFEEAKAIANDLILAIAGDGATLSMENGRIVVYAPQELDEEG